MRATLLWSGLVVLVALGVFTAFARVIAIADVATPVTTARLAAATALIPEYAGEIQEMERHFLKVPRVTVVHVGTGAVFLSLGLLQFAPPIRKRYLPFHRRSGYLLVALAVVAGTTGVWLGVVDPYSSTERPPSAAAGALFVIAPVVAIIAIRRGQKIRHREWMIRFFATGVAIVVIRLVGAPILLLLRPAPARDVIGLTFWAGWLISLAVAEAWIRSTRVSYNFVRE